MTDQTFQAFGDELTKIAFFNKMRSGFVNALKEGWHGTPGNEQTWLGRGPDITPGMGRVGRAVEHFTGLGGLTKALPVGAKSMMLLGTAAMARDAMRPTDPSGLQRSRTERMSGLAGNTVGGLVGSSLAMKALPKSRLLAPILGGIGGSMVGERLMTAPWKHQQNYRQAVQQQMPVPPEYWPEYAQRYAQPQPANPGVY